MLDAHQLNVFLAAAETLSFTQAAQRTHMSQPSVSQHIQTLERIFAVPLFLRSGRNLELSDAALTLIPLAREMVALSNRIEETMACLVGNVSGHLHVACSTTPGKYILPNLLASFYRLHPLVRATCSVYSQSQSLSLLQDGLTHFALASEPENVYPELEFSHFLRDEICLLVPASHPWVKQPEIDAQELCQADLIMREEGSGTYTAVLRTLAENDISSKQLHVLLTLGNSEAIALSVQQGLGVGFVSKVVFYRLGLRDVVPIQVKGLSFSRDIFIARNKRRVATSAQSIFWEFVTKQKDQLLKEFLG